MRFQVMWKKTHLPPEAYRPFFETDSIDEAKDFAMRLRSSGISTPRCTGTDRSPPIRPFAPFSP